MRILLVVLVILSGCNTPKPRYIPVSKETWNKVKLQDCKPNNGCVVVLN